MILNFLRAEKDQRSLVKHPGSLADLDVFDLVLEAPHSPNALLHHLAVVGAVFGVRHQILEAFV